MTAPKADPRRVAIVCDDYGLGPDHDAVMRDLASAGRFWGVSCMVDGPDFNDEAQRLLSARSAHAFQIGLHVNLTEPIDGPSPVVSPGHLLAQGLRGGSALAWVSRSLDRQWRRFEDAFGSVPDFVDGHRHVHLVPGVARAVADRLQAEGFTGWVRGGMPDAMLLQTGIAGLKVPLIATLAAFAAPVYAGRGLRLARYLSGIIRLGDVRTGTEAIARSVRAIRHSGVLMVHPGCATDARQTVGHDPALREAETRLIAEGTLERLLAESGSERAQTEADFVG